MNGKQQDPGQDQGTPFGCSACREGLQEYLDGTLDKKMSLRFFLHLRDCSGCQQEYEQLQGLFDLLENLPSHEAPADFDDAILASVPYAAYRAMEPLRRERVPVYLEENFLPRLVRSPVTRLAGLAVTAIGVVASLGSVGPQWLATVALVGVVPELLVRLQGLGRRVVAPGRAEG